MTLRALLTALKLSRQGSGALASSSGRTACKPSAILRQTSLGRCFLLSENDGCAQIAASAQSATQVRTKLTVKTTTKSHRFSHHIKIDRELLLRSFWKDKRGVQNPAHLQRYVNFSRIYARFRDMEYLPHTMRDWDAAIIRLFSHERGMQPANELVRKHPYLLNVKILPLQFAKNAVKGKLPLYDWRAVLHDLKVLVGEDTLPKGEAEEKQIPNQPVFAHAKRTKADYPGSSPKKIGARK